MPITYHEGDLFKGSEKVFIHGCNTLGKMGSGFADIVKRKFPRAVRPYFDTHEKMGLNLGSVIWGESDGVLVGHCITQATIGRDGRRHVSYEAIRACMKEVNIAAIEGVPGTNFDAGFSRVAMPMIGADLGGGDWKIISKIIAEELLNAPPSVYVLPGSKHDIKNLPRF